MPNPKYFKLNTNQPAKAIFMEMQFRYELARDYGFSERLIRNFEKNFDMDGVEENGGITGLPQIYRCWCKLFFIKYFILLQNPVYRVLHVCRLVPWRVFKNKIQLGISSFCKSCISLSFLFQFIFYRWIFF